MSKQFKQVQTLSCLMPLRRSIFATVILSSASSGLPTGREGNAVDVVDLASVSTCTPPKNEVSTMSLKSLGRDLPERSSS